MKRAMSPLFSTILLIGFAIALGGIVMSWGKSEYAMEKSAESCEGVSLSLISYDNNKGVCYEGNKLHFTIQNNGEIDLGGVKVFVVGGAEIYSALVDKQMYVADVVRLDLEYPDVGKIEKIIFVPVFGSLSEERLCPKNGFSAEGISECLNEKE